MKRLLPVLALWVIGAIAVSCSDREEQERQLLVKQNLIVVQREMNDFADSTRRQQAQLNELQANLTQMELELQKAEPPLTSAVKSTQYLNDLVTTGFGGSPAHWVLVNPTFTTNSVLVLLLCLVTIWIAHRLRQQRYEREMKAEIDQVIERLAREERKTAPPAPAPKPAPSKPAPPPQPKPAPARTVAPAPAPPEPEKPARPEPEKPRPPAPEKTRPAPPGPIKPEPAVKTPAPIAAKVDRTAPKPAPKAAAKSGAPATPKPQPPKPQPAKPRPAPPKSPPGPVKADKTGPAGPKPAPEPAAKAKPEAKPAAQPARKKVPPRPASKKCKVAGCKSRHRSKGFCNKHYQQWRKGLLTEPIAED